MLCRWPSLLLMMLWLLEVLCQVIVPDLWHGRDLSLSLLVDLIVDGRRSPRAQRCRGTPLVAHPCSEQPCYVSTSVCVWWKKGEPR